jgi:hypothetical protein
VRVLEKLHDNVGAMHDVLGKSPPLRPAPVPRLAPKPRAPGRT